MFKGQTVKERPIQRYGTARRMADEAEHPLPPVALAAGMRFQARGGLSGTGKGRA